MKTAIIIHGKPERENYFDPKADSQSNCHWIPWLQQQLNIQGVLTQTPEMPAPYDPDYQKWSAVFEQFTLDEETTLVGHSCGAGFLVKYLSERHLQVGKVVLVAPWLDPQRNSTTMFNELKIDAKLVDRTKGITIFASSNDYDSIKESVKILQEAIKGVKTVEFQNYGHFCLNDMKTREFPELLNEILI